MVRKIELEQYQEDPTFWKWKILECDDGRIWIVVRQGMGEGYDAASHKAKEAYAMLKLQ